MEINQSLFATNMYCMQYLPYLESQVQIPNGTKKYNVRRTMALNKYLPFEMFKLKPISDW
jgi:hypothetical protein